MRKKHKHPPAANDDTTERLNHLPNKTDTTRLLDEGAVGAQEARQRPRNDAASPLPDTAETEASEILAALLQHLPADALQMLEACARSPSAWDALHEVLAAEPELSAVA